VDELPADAVEVGRIAGAWGVKGGIKVRPISPDPQALLGSRRWHLRPPEDGLPARPPGTATMPIPTLLKVTSVRRQGEHVVAMAQDLDQREQAEALKGLRVFVARSSFPSTADDEFYWVDLIGLGVHNRQARALGRVVGLIETGPHCVLRIVPPDRAETTPADELLIPFVAAYVDAVDLAGRRITVDWPLDDETTAAP
jgi:16S rRNA processing protein RimM